MMAEDYDRPMVSRADWEAVGEENARLREALETAQGEAYLGLLDGDDTPDPLTACQHVLDACMAALRGAA